MLGADEWKSVLLTNVYNHFLIKTFGKETTARRKTEQLINETINEFCRVWGFSRKYETRHCDGKDFLDFLKFRIVERTTFTYHIMDNMNVRKLDLTPVELINVTCSMVAALLRKGVATTLWGITPHYGVFMVKCLQDMASYGVIA